MDFITGRKDGKYRAGRDGSTRFTLPGLITGEAFTQGAYGEGHLDALKWNFKRNAFPMISTVVAAPIVITAARKFLAKPLINPLNKILRMANIDGVKF